MSTKTSKSELIGNINETLEVVKLGINLYKNGTPAEKKAGIRNVVVFGRAVTNSIQKYKGLVDSKEFDIWYIQWQNLMKQDLGMKFLYKERSVILKEGILRTGTSFFINKLTPKDFEEYCKLAPPNAISFFMGDNDGGIGFIVAGEDGKETKYYVELPKTDKFSINLEMKNVPTYTTYDGTLIESTEDLFDYYYQFLGVMVKDLELKFP